MRAVTIEDVVKLKFTLFDDSGELVEKFDTPIDMVLGKGMIMPGLEKLILGKNIGDRVVQENIPKLEAFGEWNKSNESIVQLSDIPVEMELEEGGMLQAANKEGQAMMGKIKEIYDDFIIVDYNHPLAGKDLKVDFEIYDIYTFDPENPPAPPTAPAPPVE
ncbi:MAG: FKBP-type peptidyl-prolyl cis-trans isomerase [Flavobacteriales bacterium]|nr:FKBP-type peptidyl-prolyl cis-trans isomerase [Flavobacteriales bacterium]